MILIFDPFNGISGDMTVGALLDAGLPLEHLERGYRSLRVDGLAVGAELTSRAGIRATKFSVHCAQPKAHRHLSHIEKIIESSELGLRVREWAIAIFRKLAEAEAEVHGTTVEKVHFHEVGAIDSIADIVGAAVGFDYFSIERFFTHPVNVGYGTIKCEHGVLPVPPPATALLLRQFEIFSGTVPNEMTTPTGAAILAALAKPMPAALTARRRAIGYGAGDRDFPQTPNVLRIFLAEDTASLPGRNEIIEMQTNIDDMNPQLYGPLIEKLLTAGALDVFYQPVTMKRGRPAVLLTVLCETPYREAISTVLFRETTTLGVRYQCKQREILDRVWVSVDTLYGAVRIKVAQSAGISNYAAEFEDCQKLADAAGVPVKEVYGAAMAVYWETRRAK